MLPLKPNHMSRFACFSVLCAAVTLIACGGGSNGGVPVPVTLQSLTVASQNTSVAAGLTQQFTATGNFSDGTTKPVPTVNWSTSDATLATISPTGLLSTLKQGVVTVTAASGAATGSASFNVGPAVPTSLVISPANASVAAGLTQQFTATGSFTDGTSKPLATVSWSTPDATLATISPTGLLNTLKQGGVTVTAASGAATGSVSFNIGPAVPTSLVISPASASVTIGAATPSKLSAILGFTDKSTQDISGQVTWGNTNPFTASIDATGNVTAVHTGYTKVVATNGTFSAAADFTVLAVPRFLYVSTAAGRLVSRTTIDAVTGQLRMAGYMQTNSNNSAASPCQTTDPSNQFLYVGSFLNSSTPGGEIQIYSIDQSAGSLTPVLGGPFAIPDPIGCIQFEPTGKFGYANTVVNGTNQLLTYSRDSNSGALTRINSISLNSTALQVAVDPLGKYLYVTTIALTNPSTVPAQAYGYSIDSSTGALTPIAGTPFLLSNATGVFSWHPSGNFLYAANSNGLSIDVYSADRATGKLSFGSSVATCINPTTVRFSPNGKFAYTACSMDANHDPKSASVESFAVATDGTLTHIGTTPSADAPFNLAIDPSGQFLYLNANSSYVYSFQVGANGVAQSTRKIGVEPNQGPSLAIVGGSTAVKYAPKFAYVTSTGDNKLSTYAVQTDGTLAAQPSTATQLSPFSLSLIPWGSNLLHASRAASPNLTAYPLATTGNPGAPVNFGNAATAGGVAIDPSERWAFETDSTNATVSTFQRVGANWAPLSYLVNGNLVTIFPAGAGAGPTAVDPFGRFLYVANQGANSISAYQYFGTSPELFESTGTFVLPYTDGSPFAVGAKPVALAVDSTESFLYVACNDKTVRVFAIDYYSGGHIAQIATASLAGQPAGVAAEPTGRFVYVADSTGVRAFYVNAQSGALTPVPLSPAISLTNIAGLYVEPSGKYLYLMTDTGVFAYTINADGTLTAVSAAAVATSNHPSSMTFSVDIR
jgi:6-phosphogluconolactonase (cycloisomerase 2 family)